MVWIKFQLEDLCTAETDVEICKMLHINLPKDLGETYNRLLGRIMVKQREELIRKMFKWILCSKRPLHIDEIQEAVAFTIDDSCWDESKIPNDIARLVRACGNLVVIDEKTTIIQFAHYTIEQYLLSSLPEGPGTVHLQQRGAMDAGLVHPCTQCLSLLAFYSSMVLGTLLASLP